MSTVESSRLVTLPRGAIIFPFLFVFLYFFFSSGELLHIQIWIFKPKITHVVAVLLFGYFWILTRKIILPRPLFYPFLWILLSLICSSLFSAQSLRTYGYIGVYLFNFIFYFLLPLNLFRYFQPSKLLKFYMLSFLCLGLYAILQSFLSLFEIYDSLATQRVGSLIRGQAWTYEPSYYALYITAYVMFKNAWAIFRPRTSFSMKETWKLLGINCLLLASTSTGLVFSYPAFCAVCLWMTFLRPVRSLASYAKRRIVNFIAFCCVFTGILTYFFWDLFVQSFFKFFYFGFMTHFSFSTRWQGLISSFNVFLQNPLFGVGVGGVSPYLFKETSFYETTPEMLAELESCDPTTIFTEILASLGMVGFLGFIFLAMVFYRIFKSVIVSSQISQPDKLVSIALFISLIVLLIVLQFNQGLFRPCIWIHAGVVYGYLHQLHSNASVRIPKANTVRYHTNNFSG